MPKFPVLSGNELIGILIRLGFSRVRQKGSHVSLRKETSQGVVGCVVPIHKELAIGALRGILRQAKISTDEFFAILEH